MKAISDVKMKKIIKRLLGCDATYTLGNQEGKITLNEALIAEAKKMTRGKERRVLFYGYDGDTFSDENGGVARLYMHQCMGSAPGEMVCVELFSGSQRSYMNVIHDEPDDSWRCTERVILGDGIHVTARADVNDTIWKGDIGNAKVVNVTLADKGGTHTLTLDAEYLRDCADTSEYYIGNIGCIFASVIGNQLSVEMEDPSEDQFIIRVQAYY